MKKLSQINHSQIKATVSKKLQALNNPLIQIYSRALKGDPIKCEELEDGTYKIDIKNTQGVTTVRVLGDRTFIASPEGFTERKGLRRTGGCFGGLRTRIGSEKDIWRIMTTRYGQSTAK